MPARRKGAVLRLLASIAIPGTPIDQLAVMAIDPATGLGYLADKDNAGVVVFDTTTDTFLTRIGGFVGLTGKGTSSGPNGVCVVDPGRTLWVSDGDSTVKVVDTGAARITATIPTGGQRRANGMAHAPDAGVVLVANSNETTPFLSLISTAPGHAVVAQIPLPETAENIERSAYNPANGRFYTVIPVSTREGGHGLLAETDAATGRLIGLHDLPGCHPHSLQVIAPTKLFLGCSAAHGPDKRPGGDLVVYDIPTGRIVARVPDGGGNGSSTLDRERGLCYHATTAGRLIVIDGATDAVVQVLPTSKGARSVGVGPSNGRVYLATTARHGPCGGCIQVYDWQ